MPEVSKARLAAMLGHMEHVTQARVGNMLVFVDLDDVGLGPKELRKIRDMGYVVRDVVPFEQSIGIGKEV